MSDEPPFNTERDAAERPLTPEHGGSATSPVMADRSARSEAIEPPSIRQVTPEEGREVLRGLIEDYQRLSSDEPPRCRHAAAGATGPVLFCVLPRGHDEPHRAASGAEWTERPTDVH